MVEVIVEILIFSLVFFLGFRVYSLASVSLHTMKKDMSDFIDLVMGVDFMREEILERIRSDGFTASSTSFISFRGYSNGRVRTITYRVGERDGEYRIYRHADGEGNNVILRSRDPIRFEVHGRIVAIHVGDLVFHVFEPSTPISYPPALLESY